MKCYGQMCGLALALDVIGDRWALLVVRELLTGPKKFSEMQVSLPGCSPNLLARRLTELSESGLVIEAKSGSGPRSLYELTEDGKALREPIECLVRWGGRFFKKRKGLNERRPHWLEVAAPALLRPRWRGKSPLKIQIDVEEHLFSLEFEGGEIDVRPGRASRPDFTLQVPYEQALGILSGYLPFDFLRRSDGLLPGRLNRADSMRVLKESFS